MSGEAVLLVEDQGVFAKVLKEVVQEEGYRLIVHPRLAAPLRRYTLESLPFVLLGLGMTTLAEAGSFALLK
jgi:DNA-binding response OmpR family regulator